MLRNEKANTGPYSVAQTLSVLTGATSLAAGGLSLAASENPDGLEWSLEKIAGTTELESSGIWHGAAAQMQELTALWPDYSFQGSESAWGTVFSGLAGSALVILLCVACCYLFKLFKHNEA